MPVAVTVRIGGDALPYVASISRQLQGDELKAVLGRGGTNVVFEHFVELERERSGKEFPGAATHFYSSAAKSLGAPGGEDGFQPKRGVVRPVPQGVTVNINHVGIAQRFFGGPIDPIPPKKFLTIPA